jgi:hypothetical protein
MLGSKEFVAANYLWRAPSPAEKMHLKRERRIHQFSSPSADDNIIDVDYPIETYL